MGVTKQVVCVYGAQVTNLHKILLRIGHALVNFRFFESRSSLLCDKSTEREWCETFISKRHFVHSGAETNRLLSGKLGNSEG